MNIREKTEKYPVTLETSTHQKTIRDSAIVQLVAAAVAIEFDVNMQDMLNSLKGASEACLARQVAIYLVHVVFQFKVIEVAHAFGRDRTTITHACHLIEDRRENFIFDEKITRLEDFLEASPIRILFRSVA